MKISLFMGRVDAEKIQIVKDRELVLLLNIVKGMLIAILEILVK